MILLNQEWFSLLPSTKYRLKHYLIRSCKNCPHANQCPSSSPIITHTCLPLFCLSPLLSPPIMKFINKITFPPISFFSNNLNPRYYIDIMNVKEKFGPCRVNLDILESRKKLPNRTTFRRNLFSQETNRKQ